jgi:hypothetical protein
MFFDFSQLFWEMYVFFLTSPNFFGRSMFFWELFWEKYVIFWEKYVFFFTCPNIFGRCKGNVGRCHIVHLKNWWLYKKVGRSLDKCVTPRKSFSP